MRNILIGLILLLLSTSLQAQTIVNGRQRLNVDINDPQAFAAAWAQVNDNPTQPATLVLTATEPGSDIDELLNFDKNPLGPLSADVLILPGDGLGEDPSFSATGNTDPVFAVAATGTLGIHGIGVGPSDAGGVVLANGGQFHGHDVNFHDNTTPGSGGGIFCGVNSECQCDGCQFENNLAGQNGGAFSCQQGATCDFSSTTFRNNGAGVFGCDMDVNGGNVTVRNGAATQDRPACTNTRVEVPSGNVLWGDYYLMTVNGNHDAIDCTGFCELHNTLVHVEPGNSTPRSFLNNTSGNMPELEKGGSLQGQCNDFGSGAITSLGFNVDSDSSCFLNKPTDLPNTNPMIVVDANGIPQPQAGSPVIESGPVNFVNNELPCIYKDLNGLGRPQDFDLDGVFTCDRGPVEIQGGPDIGAPQSAAFYDLDRNGEGAYVEVLEDGRAVVSFYSYTMDGTGLVWIIGLGQVVGNSVVIDDMQRVTGGVFGAGFDPNTIVRTTVGGLSLVFPDCDAVTNPGRLNFTARDDSGLENLLQKASRLTSIVDCDGSAPAANAHRSGAFYAPDRSGEGIFVQWLSDGRMVFVFYTFDTEGNAFWVISDDTVINGNTVTATMVYAAGKSKFGANFNPAEVTLAPWGTITLTYTDDNNLTFAYDSVLAGFGTGSYAYTRLTSLAGT